MSVYCLTKGQLISKANCPAVNSSKKQTNEFLIISMRHVFVHFLDELEDSKKAFQNYLTFNTRKTHLAAMQPHVKSYSVHSIFLPIST